VDWPHAPLHRFAGDSIYFVTASTYGQQHVCTTPERLEALQSRLFRLARLHTCSLQGWSIFANHYHLVVSADGGALRAMITRLHGEEGVACNQDDGVVGRQVWFQFRETELTFERSWLARLRYTHENAVHHRLVAEATKYRWCSASWFETNARPAFIKVVKSFKIDRLKIDDDFL
jgi:putative transposase